MFTRRQILPQTSMFELFNAKRTMKEVETLFQSDQNSKAEPQKALDVNGPDQKDQKGGE